jgi:NADPH:quinone reductase-like Zn-dependent oxidoreductase
MRSLEMPHGFGALGRLVLGIRGPRRPVLGSEVAGEVEAVGRAVTGFQVGDEVVAMTGTSLGCHAEYVCLRADGAVAPKPPNLSFSQAAALCFGGATMLDFFRRAELRSGERVLVNGASGTVGSAAVQLARHFGAHVTAVCSGGNSDLVRAIGADDVIDYTRSDFTQSGMRFDVIVDTAGTAPFARSRPALSRGGRLLLVLATLPELLKAPWHTLTSGRKVIAGPAAERPEYVRQLVELAAAGRFTPLIDRCYPLAQIVEAHRYVDGGHKKGSVVLTVGPAGT